MSLTFETTEANLAAVPLTDNVITASRNSTFIGTLDADQNAFISVSAPSIGLDGTSIRSDIYAIEVSPNATYSIELAIDGAFGGTLDQFAFIIAGDNGSTRPSLGLGQDQWTLLATSTANTGNLFQQAFEAGPHGFLYVIISADEADEGTYSLSVADSPGAVGDDTLRGADAQDDVLIGFRGDDAIDGLSGQDTARYLQNDEVFSLLLGAEIQLIDRAGNEGTDTLSSIEILDFLDTDFDLSRFDDVASLSTEQFSSFTEMYIAYFNRAPDSAGLMFWANAFATGTSLEEIAKFFAESPEAQAIYPLDAPSSTFVEAIYLNVLGRASDAGGAAFWTSVLESGSKTRDEFVLEVLRGARADTPSDATEDFIAQQLVDVSYLDNKIDVGIYFSAILGMSDLANAKSVMQLFDGTVESIQSAKIAADDDFVAAQASDGSGEFLIQLVGVIDDPFSIA